MKGLGRGSSGKRMLEIKEVLIFLSRAMGRIDERYLINRAVIVRERLRSRLVRVALTQTLDILPIELKFEARRGGTSRLGWRLVWWVLEEVFARGG